MKAAADDRLSRLRFASARLADTGGNRNNPFPVEIHQAPVRSCSVAWLEVVETTTTLGGTTVTSPVNTPRFAVGAITDSFGIISQTFRAFGSAFNIQLDALERKGAVTTLAQPTLVALSGETASFLAGGEFPVPTVQGEAHR